LFRLARHGSDDAVHGSAVKNLRIGFSGYRALGNKIIEGITIQINDAIYRPLSG